ncbi:hypothetical protein KZZ52_18135 [Dactylosporangium sp. AC04546]|uniref:hypothetical protein n=1 Tax=Dactylosporangium sp. AC04546 TaxID=2862460 RepID=UPI001EE00F39|nr:hypothetical protein [Dactylosporangium sp. AC04546]WVK87221.1 hypothetical protein KZZ52_18135 [Dactylosporangium sp. AC04546]
MRTAVVRVVFDRDGTIPATAYEAGLRRLRELGLEVVASPAERLPARNREVELIVAGLDPADVDNHVDKHVALCADAFGAPATAGVVTYVSRGTDDDARGVLAAFGVDGTVRRLVDGDEELVTVTLVPGDLRRVPESRLHTALEAALNCEVRIVAGGSPR